MKFRAVICRLTLAALITAIPLSSFASDDDDRNTIVLRPKERSLMLEDMRNYLNGIKQITLAIAKEDMTAIERSARAMGEIAIYKVKPTMTPSLVPKFRELSFDLHTKFEALADSAAAGDRQPLQLLGDLSLLMNQCVKCHESYSIGDSSH